MRLVVGGGIGGLAAARGCMAPAGMSLSWSSTADHLVVVGRGKVIADTSVTDFIAGASGDHVELRTAERADAMKVLSDAGAEVIAIAPDVLLVKGLSADRTVAALTAGHVTFAEVTTHRATLEEAYMELTRDAVEYRAAPAAGGTAR